MMRPHPLVATVAALGFLAACSGSKPTATPTPTTTTVRHSTVRAPQPTRAISPTDAAAAKYNPTHDPNKCVLILANGNVQLTLKEPVPKGAKPNPAYVNQPTVPTPPMGKCG